MVFKNASKEQHINIVVHELNHFMFYYYFPHLKEKLKEERFEDLKETLTVLTNPEEKGYPAHQKLRQFIWRHRNQSLENTIGLIVENKDKFWSQYQN